MSSGSSSGRGNFPLTFVLSVQDQGVGAKFNQVKSSLQGTTQAADPLNKSLATTDQNLKKTGTSADGLGKKVQGTKQPLNQATTATKSLGTAQDSTAKKTGGMAAGFQKNKGLS